MAASRFFGSIAPMRNSVSHRRAKLCYTRRLALRLLVLVVAGFLVFTIALNSRWVWHNPGTSPIADSLSQSIAGRVFQNSCGGNAPIPVKSSASVIELIELQEEHLNAALNAAKKDLMSNSSDLPMNFNTKPGSLGIRSDGRMNILMVVADDYRPESSVYGKSVSTPNIDRLARRGVTFDRAFAQITVCNPSRASFLSGRAPDVLQLWNFERAIQGPIVTMPEYFNHLGYTVVGTGKNWHWEPGPGYDTKVAAFWPDSRLFQKLMRRDRLILKSMNRTISPFDGLFETYDIDFVDALFAKRACRLIDLLAEGKAEDGTSLNIPEVKGPLKSVLDSKPPFFLAVGFHLPHEPYLIPDASWKDFDESKDRRLRGPIAVRPFGMPPYAGGDMYSEVFNSLGRYPSSEADVLMGYQYINISTDRGSVEVAGETYGPMSNAIAGESPLERIQRDVPYPDLMRSELYRGYATGVSYMDKQLGKVLDRLRDTGLEESTLVVFCSDHGYDLGERGQWGKRNLFESNARIPLIFADPRYQNAHGARTPLLAELVDLFPTLTDLAGLAAPVGLVPPLAGHSLAQIVRNPTTSATSRKYALTQFSRCPITASEFLRDIQGQGPLIMQGRVSVDYRTRPDRGAQVGNWECAWKGWEWNLHHDLVLMGYSLRSYKWRYSAWVLWDSNTTLPIWTYPPFGEELYEHSMGTKEPASSFDNHETTNLLAVGGVGSNNQGTPTEQHRKVARYLFSELRTLVIDRRGAASDAFYMCDRIGSRPKRIQCQTQVAASQSYDNSLKAQLFDKSQAQESDSRKSAQREPALALRHLEPVLTLPLEDADTMANFFGQRPSLCSPKQQLKLDALQSMHVPFLRTPVVRSGRAVLPPAVAGSLRRLKLYPGRGMQLLSVAVAAYESVVQVGDEVLVGNADVRMAQLQAHRLCRQWTPSSGARFRISRVMTSDDRRSTDLLLELVREEGPITADDTQAMGLGYVARKPINELAEAAKEALRTPTRAAWLNEHPLFEDLNTSDAASLFEHSLDSKILPKLLYARSRAPALRKGAAWVDRVDYVQWLPADLNALDERLRLMEV